MSTRLNSHEAAKWFIYHNPSLSSGNSDDNIKLNKLLYLSGLMYYCIKKRELFDEPFIGFPNGPVISSVYEDYHNNGLNKLPVHDKIKSIDSEQQQIINIINFVYGDKSSSELLEEKDGQSLWKQNKTSPSNNQKIDFGQTGEEMKTFYQSLYAAYKGFDFSDLKKDKINGNLFYYSKSKFSMTNEIVNQLSQLDQLSYPQYVEIIDGEIVLS